LSFTNEEADQRLILEALRLVNEFRPVKS
jgi:hypothetical protein